MPFLHIMRFIGTSMVYIYSVSVMCLLPNCDHSDDDSDIL